jgi:hypothetical protein
MFDEMYRSSPGLRMLEVRNRSDFIVFKSLFMAGVALCTLEVTKTMAEAGPRELMELCVALTDETRRFVKDTMLAEMRKPPGGQTGVEVPPEIKL